MKGLAATFGAAVGGSIGWWLGAQVGLMTAVVLSSVGAGAGVYVMRRLVN